MSISTSDPASGQCLCGTVTFDISGDLQGFFLCHCSRCRKDTGSAHAANLFFASARLNWPSGEEHIRHFRLSGSRHAKCFCTKCGSALPFEQAEDDVVVVPAGSLDGPIGMKPSARICFSSRADWDDDLAALEKIDGLPG
ncbi:aldehyde-activating protein [Oceanicola sp. 502str15]|nr:GFA family protein [Oceanicola sp. 502str15]MCO6383005.1 aldehyde-activating protein [Oceanicola sp. 502str15]